jgi:DNA-binding GntR family transcriptional regulator
MRQVQKSRSKNEMVYDAIRTAILQSELEPGARLVIDELASALSVSQIPVREALRQLEADGFVVIEPYIGATVAPIEADSVFEVFSLLEAMEIISGRAACRSMSESDLDELESMLRQMDVLIDDPEVWSHANVKLHEFISLRAGTPLVKQMMDKVLHHWDRVRSYYLKDVSAVRINVAQQQHWEMFTALRARDPDHLETVVRQHNQDALAAYTAHLSRTAHTKGTELDR